MKGQKKKVRAAWIVRNNKSQEKIFLAFVFDNEKFQQINFWEKQ